MTLPRSKVCFLLFSSRFLLLELVFLIILVCFHLCCVFWCLACRFVLCAVVDPSSRQPNSPTTNLHVAVLFCSLIGSPVTLTPQRHILTLHRSLPSPLCLFTSPLFQLSFSVSLFSGPIRRPAVDPESLESVMMCLYIPCHAFLYDFLNRPDSSPYKFTLFYDGCLRCTFPYNKSESFL